MPKDIPYVINAIKHQLTLFDPVEYWHHMYDFYHDSIHLAINHSLLLSITGHMGYVETIELRKVNANRYNLDTEKGIHLYIDEQSSSDIVLHITINRNVYEDDETVYSSIKDMLNLLENHYLTFI